MWVRVPPPAPINKGKKMKQQVYEKLLAHMVQARDDKDTLNNLLTKAAILLERGDKSASVVREYMNK